MTTLLTPTTQVVAAPPAPTPTAAPTTAPPRQALIDHFLESQDPKTRQEYGRALAGFVAFSRSAYELTLPLDRTLDDWFLALDGGAANEAALRWRTHLYREQRFAPKTVNLRLSALRSLVKVAKLAIGWLAGLGTGHWSLRRGFFVGDKRTLSLRPLRPFAGGYASPAFGLTCVSGR